MESVLFWITIASCFVSVQMAVWEPLLILNVTGKKSVSPLDIWNDQESRQPPQDITAEDWIRDENKTSPFVSDRISHWDIVRPEMIEVKAVNFKHNDVQIVQSILFNTTTSNSSSFDDWMKEEYLSNQNRTTEAIETPAQLQPRNALFRYNYTSNGAIGRILGGIIFLLDTRNVSERGSLLLTSDVRDIGNIEDILFNLNTHMYQSSMQGTEEVFNSNNQERISSTNHKIVFRERITTEQRRLVRLRYEMEEGVFVKNLSIRSSGPIVVNMTLNDGSQTSEVADILNFYKEYNKRILTIVITPEMPELKFIYGMEVNVMYTYLPYDVADYFVIRGRFVTCDEPPDIPNTVIEGIGTTAGSSRTYTCTNGTSVVSGSDPATSHCQSNGNWSSPNIQCHVNCGDPTGISNTAMNGSGTTAGSARTYTCKTGTSLVSGVDPITSYCQNGEWSRPNIKCEVPTTTDTGSTSITSIDTTSGTTEMTTSFTATALHTTPDTTVTSRSKNVRNDVTDTTTDQTADQNTAVSTTTETGSTSITSIDTTRGTTEMTTSTTSTALHTTPDTKTTVTSNDVTNDGIDTTTDQTADQNSADRNCTTPCSCNIAFWGNTTKLEDLDPEKLAELKTAIVKLKAELTVNRTGLSTYKATKASAADERRSAAGIGAVGVLIIILVVSLVIMADVMTFLRLSPTKKIQIA